jgi:hypothetical protein
MTPQMWDLVVSTFALGFAVGGIVALIIMAVVYRIWPDA